MRRDSTDKFSYFQLIAGVAMLFASGTASAVSVLYENAFNIQDWGTDATMVFRESFELGSVDQIERVEIDLFHTWAADLGFHLVAPGKKTFSFVQFNGNDKDLGTDHNRLATYRFVQTAESTWDNGSTLTDSETLNPDTPYRAGQWQAGPFDAGTWTISLYDYMGGDSGSVGTVRVFGTPTSTPEIDGASLPLAIGLLTALIGLVRERAGSTEAA